MEVLAKGQLSYMILSCLSDRDMYGLELIDEIKARYGREIKLPSLYSNINRMKELKYISSYLKESTKGPKCSYSSITEAGRKELEELEKEFKGVSFAQPEPKKEEKPVESIFANTNIEAVSPIDDEEPEQADDYDDYFSFSDDEETEETEAIEEDKTPTFVMQEKIAVDEISEPEEDFKEQQVEAEPEKIMPQSEEEPKVVRIEREEPSANAQEYNQKLYAAAKDFSKNKNKRSYSENQIELALSTSPARSEEVVQQDLTELKSALLSSRQGHYEEIKMPEPKQTLVTVDDGSRETLTAPAPVASAPKEEIREDDGRFITDRLSEDAIPKPKRIDPPRLNILVQNYDKKLPAPKRNVSVDPTCSDVKAKLESLYAKAEVQKEPVFETTDFDSYDDLKKYYASQEVEFKVYEKIAKRPKHNTNFLKLCVSLAMLGIVGVGSAIMYLIFSLCGLTSAATNFVYYLFPIIAAVFALYNFYNYKTTQSKVPTKVWHPAIVWSMFACLIAIIFLLNYVCGMPFNEVSSYFSTILVPVFAAGCATIGIYYIQIFAYKKWWK